MNLPRKVALLMALFFWCISSAFADAPTQFGAGYGFDFRNDANLEQCELFLRNPLLYITTIYGIKITSAIEFGLGYIKQSDSSSTGAERVYIMPELILRPDERFSFILGIGAGLIANETNIANHRLGGPFLITFKLGGQLNLNKHWGIDAAFYHQSNGHIYTQNYSLNMSQLSVIYAF